MPTQATHDLEWLNALPPHDALNEFLKCCGSTRWAKEMVASRPYLNLDGLIARAKDVWWSLEQTDWLEAFRSHPRIGEKKAADHVAPQSRQWSGQEQAGVRNAAEQTVDSLAALNREYEEKFGFIFIICATGKSADEILAMLRRRLENEVTAELPIAAAEQAMITELRIRKLVG